MAQEKKSLLKSVKGTAGEAYQMHQYGKMQDKYGEDVALGIMRPHLQNIGLTTDDFCSYLKVKEAVQSGELSITAAAKEAEADVKAVMTADLAI